MKIFYARWDGEVSLLKVRCHCGQTFNHRGDRVRLRCPDGHSGDLRKVRGGPLGQPLVVHCKRTQNYCRYIGRPTIYGNPFTLKDPKDPHERKVCLRRYRVYFKIRMRHDPEFRRAVEDLRGEDLGCWCAPRSCHGDVILEWLGSHA